MAPSDRVSEQSSPWTVIWIPGLLALAAILSLGVYWAFVRGGDDFRVFYHAWRLVLDGQGAEVYRNTPDRFLYAPGFAWILAPLAVLPYPYALFTWCLIKVAVVIGLLVNLPRLARMPTNVSWWRNLGWVAWAVVWVARPVLIDFQYGQVNLLILGACVWPLFRYFDPQREGGRAEAFLDFLAWALFGVAAMTKLFPAPLFLIPLFVTPFGPSSGHRRKQLNSLVGAMVGAGTVLLIPALTVGWSGLVALYPQWRLALIDRGLPLESHNQSFAAFLYHYLSGQATQIIAQHRRPIVFGWSLLSSFQIELLAAFWALAMLGAITVRALRPPREPGLAALRYVAILIALLVVPSHLVWKPYFSFGLLAAAVGLLDAARSKSPARWALLFIVFVMINLTGFDFVGLDRGAQLEAASLFLWAHLLLCATVAWPPGSSGLGLKVEG
jgi:hypothetical protein